MSSSEFMINLHQQLRDEKKVAESTADAYLRSLTILNGKKPFKSLTFLKNTDKITDFLKDYADNTQKALLATIVSVLSLFKEKTPYKKVYQFYYQRMMGKVDEMRKDESKPTEKSEKQKENWLSWEEVNKVKEELSNEVQKNVKKRTLTDDEFTHLLHYVILSLYTDTQPRRNQDYLDMMVVKKWKDDMPKEMNYYDLKSNRFIFNKYKTSKTYGQQIVELPDSLKETLKYYIRRHPMTKEIKTDYPLLVNSIGEPLDKVNSITRVLNKIFGKKVGSSLLRHIFITDKYGGTLVEQMKDAKAMGHSHTEQQRVYNVPDVQMADLPVLLQG